MEKVPINARVTGLRPAERPQRWAPPRPRPRTLA